MAKPKISYAKPSTVAEKFVAANSNIGENRAALKEAGVVNPVVSSSTAKTYSEALTGVQKWIRDAHKGGGAVQPDFPVGLESLTRAAAEQFLQERIDQGVGQKTLDRDRQAIEFALQEHLEKYKSNEGPKGELASGPRAYTFVQMKAIAGAQSEKHAVMTELAYHAGLRAHEGFTIKPMHAVKVINAREWSSFRFYGREGGVKYYVKGKGGLERIVMVPRDLAVRLEARRLDKPETRQDKERGTTYKGCMYDIGAGKNWTRSFSRTSVKILNWSKGGHGLRHSYVQTRMDELDARGVHFKDAIRAVANEVGHFAEKTTLIYLR